MGGPSLDRVAEIREAWRRDREDRAAFWRQNWPMEVFDLIVDFGGSAALGFLLGLSALLWILAQEGV